MLYTTIRRLSSAASGPSSVANAPRIKKEFNTYEKVKIVSEIGANVAIGGVFGAFFYFMLNPRKESSVERKERNQ